MLVKTSELIGPALDWAVAKCEGHKAAQIKANGPVHLFMTVGYNPSPYSPSTNWAQGGPIIEREIGNLWKHNKLNRDEPDVWTAVAYHKTPDGTMLYHEDGPTALIAAMCCIVASKLGDTVEIPEELE